MGVRNTTLHRKPSHWMGACTPHTPATCGSLNLPAPLGPNTVPSWLGGPQPVSGNCPQGWCREEGRCEGEGPASAVTSTFDQVLLLWPLPQGLVPGPPCPGGSLGVFLLPRPGSGPQPRDPMKPNKLPKHSLSPFLEVTKDPTPYTTLVTSRPQQNQQLTWAWAGALHHTLPLGSGPPASARRPSSASPAPTRTGLTQRHLPGLSHHFK